MSTAVIGAPEFRARNGIVVRPNANGGVEVGKPGYRDYTPPEATFALEEFFQAKRDEELGRWRSPTDPDFVVREVTDTTVYASRIVSVLDERTLEQTSFTPESATGQSAKHRAARAYFEAHPERKSWGVRSPGEVWDIDVKTGGVRAVTVYSARHDEPIIVFRDAFTQVEYEEDDPSIRDARKVWGPEDAS